MEFTIYDLSELPDEEIQDFNFEEHKGNLVEVELGLSAGEVRQSLLDRFREEVQSEEAQFINLNLFEYGIKLDKYALEDTSEQDQTKAEIENILYDMDDEELDSSIWHFASEIIYVSGEEW